MMPSDIFGLLIGSGVEVGPPNGVEITFEGVSAEEVQAAIFMALTTSIVDAKSVLDFPVLPRLYGPSVRGRSLV